VTSPRALPVLSPADAIYPRFAGKQLISKQEAHVRTSLPDFRVAPATANKRNAATHFSLASV
jgi:hypothetical protein